MKRINLHFNEQQWTAIENYCKKMNPYLPVSTTLKEILLRNVTKRYETLRNVTNGYETLQNVTCPEHEVYQGSPDPACARKNIYINNINKNKNKKEDLNTHTRVQTPKPAKARKTTKLAPLKIAKEILTDLNKRAGTDYRARGTKARTLIALRLAEGFTVEDFVTVHKKKVREWKGTDMERYLTYETLYSNKFAKYLGQPDVGPKRPPAITEAEKRRERHRRRKEPGYYDMSYNA